LTGQNQSTQRKNYFSATFLNQQTHMDCLWIKSRPPQWKDGDCLIYGIKHDTLS